MNKRKYCDEEVLATTEDILNAMQYDKMIGSKNYKSIYNYTKIKKNQCDLVCLMCNERLSNLISCNDEYTLAIEIVNSHNRTDKKYWCIDCGSHVIKNKASVYLEHRNLSIYDLR